MLDLLKAFFTAENILTYSMGLIISGAIAFGMALLHTKIMVRNGIPVHKGFMYNSMIISFGGYFFVFVLLFIENTSFGAKALQITPQTVRWQVTFCLVSQTIATFTMFGCWFVLLKLYKRYERLQGDKMHRSLFGWTRDEVAASWEKNEAEKTSPRAVEEGVGKQG